MGAFADWRRQNSVFQQLAAATVLGPLPIRGRNGAELVHVGSVSADFFPLLGIQPILGRQFAGDDENPDRGNVVLLSEALWRQRFGADRDILNQSIWMGDRSFTVVGVMPASVKLFDPAGVQGWDNGFGKSDLWRPLPVDSGLRKQRNYRAFFVLGRLKPSTSLAQAQSEMTNIAGQLARDYPDSNTGWTVTVQGWQKTVVRNARLPLVLLMGAVGVVLLIATSNLANLCLARAASRQKELEIRRALGAGRLRLGGQFLTENLLLSGLGGAAGLLFAYWSLRILVGFIPADVPRVGEIALDARALGFTLGAAVMAGALSGLAPIVAFWTREGNISLKSDRRSSTGGVAGRRLRAWLVTSEVALVVVLLSGAGLLTRSLRHLNDVNLGFQPHGLAAVDVLIGGPAYTNELLRIQFVQRLLDRLASSHGFDSSSAVSGLPLDSNRANMDIAVTADDGSPPATLDTKLVAGLHLASPAYFQTMGMRLLAGRFFNARDNVNAPPVAIINETLVRRCFPGQDPLGKNIASPDFGPHPCQIVGVIGDVKQNSLDANAQPAVFRPLLQQCFSDVTLVARSFSAPATTFTAMAKAVAEVDPTWPAYNPRTSDRLVYASLAPRHFALRLMGLFAGLALALAMVGIYGVLSCSVSEGIREFSIRFALGAQPRDVLRLVLMRGMRSVAIGGMIGLAGSCALTRFLGSLLYDVPPVDPLTFCVVLVLMAVVAALACWFPALRAARVDPIRGLNHE